MEYLQSIIGPEVKKGRYIYTQNIKSKIREIRAIGKEDKKMSKRRRKTLAASGIRLLKLNPNVFHKPRPKMPKPKKAKIQPLIGNKLRDTFRFKNLRDTARAFNTSDENLNNLNSGKAGKGLSNAFRAIIAFAKEHPVRKRKKILANINFDETFSNV